jgi:enoyl-CoA hydratase/carnithine racemase
MSINQNEPPAPRETQESVSFVNRAELDHYRAKFADYFKLERHDGILEVTMHTAGGPIMYGQAVHNAWSQLWMALGNDPQNEVLILTGAEDKWIGGLDSAYSSSEDIVGSFMTLPPDLFYDRLYSDSIKLLESFIFNIDIPTISCINGPGFHTEFALLCDITLCAEHAELWDQHFLGNVVPGDGQGLTFQELMGVKRAAYYLYTGDRITAQDAKQMGLVNDVLPLERLVPRAREIAQQIMKKPRSVRRLTSAVLRRQWKRRLVQDLGFHAAHELAGLCMTNKE